VDDPTLGVSGGKNHRVGAFGLWKKVRVGKNKKVGAKGKLIWGGPITSENLI